jgi:hypothetical protein
MGVFTFPSDYDYCCKIAGYPDTGSRNVMSFERFKFIKKFINVSDPELEVDHYYGK